MAAFGTTNSATRVSIIHGRREINRVTPDQGMTVATTLDAGAAPWDNQID